MKWWIFHRFYRVPTLLRNTLEIGQVDIESFKESQRPELDPMYYPMCVVSELSVKLSCFLEVYHPDGGPGLVIDEQEGASYELVWGEEVGLCTQLADFSQSVNVLDLEDKAEVDRYKFFWAPR